MKAREISDRFISLRQAIESITEPDAARVISELLNIIYTLQIYIPPKPIVDSSGLTRYQQINNFSIFHLQLSSGSYMNIYEYL